MNPPFEDRTIEYYDRNAEEFYTETVDVDMTDIYSSFIGCLPKRGSILDAGCGSGRDSLFFTKNGFKITAFDASAKLAEKASDLTNLNVLKMRFEDVSWNEEFDGVWACASLLHVPKSEIKNILRILSRTLKKNGIMYASFKKGNSEIIENERFFSYYTEDEITSVIEKSHVFRIAKYWETTDKRKSRRDQIWINLILGLN